MVAVMNNELGFDIWCGLDVGKQDHHACALDAAGKRIFDKPLPQDQGKLEDLFTHLSERGRVLVIVDQPNTIGALPIAVARAMGIQVAYLPGLAMRRIADLHPGNTKTDARDAFIIADAARTMPHTLRRVDAGEEAIADLKVLIGFDEDLAAEATRLSNRIRGLLTQIHPALERVLGPRLSTKQALAILEQLGGPPTHQRGLEDEADQGHHQGQPPWRGRLRRSDQAGTVRADRRRGRHHGGGEGPAPAGPVTAPDPGPARRTGSPGRESPRCAPSCPGPDFDARHRSQDRRTDSPGRR